jgi:hypothetical protein
VNAEENQRIAHAGTMGRVEGNALIKDKPDPAVEEISRRLFAKEDLL